MTATQVVHACNAIIDRLQQKTQTPDVQRQITALGEIKDKALSEVATEISTA